MANSSRSCRPSPALQPPLGHCRILEPVPRGEQPPARPRPQDRPQNDAKKRLMEFRHHWFSFLIFFFFSLVEVGSEKGSGALGQPCVNDSSQAARAALLSRRAGEEGAPAVLSLKLQFLKLQFLKLCFTSTQPCLGCAHGRCSTAPTAPFDPVPFTRRCCPEARSPPTLTN